MNEGFQILCQTSYNACPVRGAIIFQMISPYFRIFGVDGRNDLNTLRVDTYFFFENGENESPLSVFKTIRIRVDQAKGTRHCNLCVI